MQNLFVYITFSTIQEARTMGSKLLESRLAACINILPGMESLYWWEDTIEKSDEIVLIAKTSSNLLEELTDFVKRYHSYSCPCIAAIPVGVGNADYFQWLAENLKKKQ
jgi:periplasmic divalent cation tolerance protein